ncbi:MAG: methyltransferase domain-containing protein [Candidatus Diapherotrites archaeon]
MPSGSKTVRDFYSFFPYPSIGLLGNYCIQKHAGKVLKASGFKAKDFNGKSVLEIGCGTGEIGCSLAFHGARVTGVDFCSASLERAEALAKKHKLKGIKFIESDLFELPKKLHEKFDLVLLVGVAHHTNAPRKAFSIACSFLRPGGIILLGLYNKTGRDKKSRRQKALSKKAGKDLMKKLELAEKMFFGRKPNEIERIYLADKYCHPLEKTFSLGRALDWIEKEKLELIGSDPKILKGKSIGETELDWAGQKRSFFTLAGKKPEAQAFHVYLAECRDGSLYCGWTDNLQKRIKAHNSGKGAKYTRAKKPVRLVYSEEFTGKPAAMRREFEIKKMARKEKERLAFG